MDSSQLPPTSKRISAILTLRILFPWVYIVLFAPLIFPNVSTGFKFTLFAICIGLGVAINAGIIKRILSIILASLTTLIPFIAIVQWARCSSQEIIQNTLSQCIANGTLGVLSTFGLGTSVLLLAAANEWRGSLLNTINRLHISRSMKMISIVGSVLIGEFRKAMIRAHLAFATRGQANPSLSWRNVIILPLILGCVWAAVLKMAADRLDLQWSSQTFWDKYIPAKSPVVAISVPDILIIFVVAMTLVLLINSASLFFV